MTNFDEKILGLVRNYRLAAEQLTEQQLASALKQALQAGDFQKYCRASDNGQQIVYIPFNEVEQLRNRIEHLKSILEANDINESEYE